MIRRKPGLSAHHIIRALCFTILLCTTSLVHAQQNDVDTICRHSFRVESAVQELAVRDDAGSPIHYDGILTPLDIAYEYHASEYRHLLHFSMAFSGINGQLLRNTTNPRDAVYASVIRFGYSYLRSFYTSDDGLWQLRFGATLDNVLYANIYKFDDADLQSSGGSFSYTGASMVEASLQAECHISDALHVQGRLSLPIVTAILRPPYNFYNSETNVIEWGDIHVVFPGAVLAWDISLSAAYALSDAFVLDVSCRSQFLRYSRYDWTSAEYMQGVGAGLRWRFAL